MKKGNVWTEDTACALYGTERQLGTREIDNLEQLEPFLCRLDKSSNIMRWEGKKGRERRRQG